MKGREHKSFDKKKTNHFTKNNINNDTYVPILNWSSNFTENNLRIWKEQMAMYAMREFGHLGLLFEENEYYEPPEVDLPETEDGSDPFSKENDPHGLELEDYKNQIKERRSAIAKLEANKIPLYAFMMTKLSAQSRTAIMREPEWEVVESKKDALALWLLIQTTHLGGNGGSGGTRVIPGETDRLLYKNLESTKQGEMEPLSTYLRKFNCSLECYDGAGIERPSVSIQVAIFVDNLHDQRFKHFKSKLKNDYHQYGLELPECLNEAFRRASDWEIDNPIRYHSSSTSKTAVSYHTNMKSRGRGRGRGSREDRGKASQERKREGEESPTCYFCEEKGHIIRNCDKYKTAKSSIHNDHEAHVRNESRHAVMALAVAVDRDIFDEAELSPPTCELEQHAPTGPNDVLLDSQSQDHIFQSQFLLSDVKTVKEVMTVYGQVAGADFSTNQAGKFMSLARKVYSHLQNKWHNHESTVISLS
jgi:hypothetical protein